MHYNFIFLLAGYSTFLYFKKQIGLKKYLQNFLSNSYNVIIRSVIITTTRVKPTWQHPNKRRATAVGSDRTSSKAKDRAFSKRLTAHVRERERERAIYSRGEEADPCRQFLWQNPKSPTTPKKKHHTKKVSIKMELNAATNFPFIGPTQKKRQQITRRQRRHNRR